jgi:hypothetical protein
VKLLLFIGSSVNRCIFKPKIDSNFNLYFGPHSEGTVNGDVLTLSSEVFRQEFKRGGAFQEALLRHKQSLSVLSSQMVLCNRLHPVEMRLARWLLTVHDRVGDHYRELTHEFLAGMLGTRRAGVTEAAGALREAVLIVYGRGHIQILDRAGLEAIACECYAIARDQLQHLVS